MYKFDNEEYYRGYQPWLLVLGLFFAMLIFGALSQLLISLLLKSFDVDILQLLSSESIDTTEGLWLAVYNAVVLILTMGGAGYAILRLDQRSFSHLSAAKTGVYPGLFFTAFFVIYFGSTISELLQRVNMSVQFPEWVMSMQDQADATLYKILAGVDHPVGIIVLLITVAVVPAFVEELVFRGVLQNLLHKWVGNVHWAIIISGAVFSAIHLQFMGFLPRMFLGIVLGYMYYWSRSFWMPVFGHFCFNGFSLLAVMFLKNSGKSVEEIANEVPSISSVSVIFTGVIFLFLFASYQRGCWLRLNTKN